MNAVCDGAVLMKSWNPFGQKENEVLASNVRLEEPKFIKFLSVAEESIPSSVMIPATSNMGNCFSLPIYRLSSLSSENCHPHDTARYDELISCQG